MPGVIGIPEHNTITKFTNCRLLRGDSLVNEDLWVSSLTGNVLSSQATFFDGGILPDQVVDLGGRIVSPGLLDVQLNGAFGFNFSTLPDTENDYVKSVQHVNRRLVETGVTSYMPTLTSQRPELYQKVRSCTYNSFSLIPISKRHCRFYLKELNEAHSMELNRSEPT